MSSARRNTIELLRGWTPTFEANPTLPEVSPNSNDYTPDRVKMSLAYSSNRLTNTLRKVSPISQKALLTMKNVCKDLLMTKDKNEKEDLVTALQLCECAIHGSVALRHLNSPTEQKFQERLLELRKYELYCRYGDYLAVLTKHLRKMTKVENMKNYNLISSAHYWNDINKAIEDEKTHWQASLGRRKVNPNDIRYHRIVQDGCKFIGLNMDQTLDIIAAYAMRNSLAHLGLMEMLREEQMFQLKTALLKDLTDLEVVVPQQDINLARTLRLTIVFLLDRWFEYSYQPAKPETWNNKDQLYRDVEAMKGTGQFGPSETQERLIKEHAQNLQATIEAKRQARALAAGSESSSSGKEKASQQPTGRTSKSEAYKNDMEKYRAASMKTNDMHLQLMDGFPDEFDERDLE